MQLPFYCVKSTVLHQQWCWLTKQPSIHTEVQPAPYKQASDSVHVANEQAEEGRETLHMF